MPTKTDLKKIESQKTVQETQKPIVKTKATKPELFTGTGKRKTAVASVFLTKSKGDILINEKAVDTFLRSSSERNVFMRPFHLVGIPNPASTYAITVKVSGSGHSSQLQAIAHGISRVLAKMDAEYSKILRKQGLLTRDPRMVERKKPFLRKARKAPQYSKR